MNKEQFLAMSLPHGVFFHSEMDDVEDMPLSGERWEMVGLTPLFGELCADTKNNDAYPIRTIKPILHPLSDLTKEIEHKMEKFVPIVELAKMIYQHHDWRLSSCSHYAVVGNGYMTFEYDYGYNCFLCNNSAQLDQLECLFKMLEWHFDLFGGIDSCDAIDVNLLHENPYK